MKVWKHPMLFRRVMPLALAAVTLFFGGAFAAPTAFGQETAPAGTARAKSKGNAIKLSARAYTR